MKKLLVHILVLFLSVNLFTGCASAKTQIAYTVYPIGFLAERIMGTDEYLVPIQENVVVQRATLKSNYEEILENSAVFIHIGQMEPYLSMYNSKFNSIISSQIDLSVLNAVYDFNRYTPVTVGDTVTYIESTYYKGEVFDHIDVDTKDLYLWIDPIAMLSMAKNIRDWLIEYFPDNQALFKENYKKLETELINLDAQFQSLATSNTKENKQIRFVTMTASFGNWQKTYGFEVYPVILSKYGVLPNKAQLEIIKQRIIDDHVKYIVYEPNMTPDMIALFYQLEDELNLKRVEMSNLSSLTKNEEELGKDYLSIMYENLKTLETMTEDRAVVQETE